MSYQTRRDFLKRAGCSAAALPFLINLPSLASDDKQPRKQRLIIMFSPNGTVPEHFWPDQTGETFELKTILKPLEPFKNRMLTLKGISNKVRGDGDSHMRGMSCLLTGIELFPGNIQGGSDTPAGWASGISIDQELKNFFQSKAETQTRLGSLHFGVQVPNRADPWTRMSYAGPNQPVAPVNDPYQMFGRLYGSMKDRQTLTSILDDVREDLNRFKGLVSVEDRHLLEQHTEIVRATEQEILASKDQVYAVPPPEFAVGVEDKNDNMPELSKMQIDLLVNSFVNDVARVSTLQYTNSVGGARMKWIGVEESHHGLSHDPDNNEESHQKLVKINTWFAEQLVYLVDQLANTKDPGTDHSLLDNTTVVWTNELGKGNSHTLDDIPFVLVGNGLDLKMGRALHYKEEAHNRLLLAFAHQMGHKLETFGKPELCTGGVLQDLV